MERLDRPLQQILATGNELRKAGLVDQTKVDGRVAYVKEGFLDQYKAQILRFAADPKARERLPTKVSPRGAASAITIKVSPRSAKTTRIHVGDIEAFAKVKRVRSVPGKRLRLLEKVFKAGVQKLLGEPGKFTDWGGEENDLLATRATVAGKRRVAAFAFKGRGQKGVLKPSDLGKNGDQIQRLFKSDADVFVVQYWGQIAPSVPEQMKAWATVRAYYEDRRVYYGIIDGEDSDRLVLAYPKAFKLPTQ